MGGAKGWRGQEEELAEVTGDSPTIIRELPLTYFILGGFL